MCENKKNEEFTMKDLSGRRMGLNGPGTGVSSWPRPDPGGVKTGWQQMWLEQHPERPRPMT